MTDQQTQNNQASSVPAGNTLPIKSTGNASRSVIFLFSEHDKSDKCHFGELYLQGWLYSLVYSRMSFFQSWFLLLAFLSNHYFFFVVAS